MRDIVIRAYSRDDMADISGILKHVGWEDFYVEGQQKAIQKLVKDEEGQAFVATVNGVVVGYVVVQHHSWNRLSQLQGLCVSMRNRRMGVAKHLVGRAEHESLNRGCRGIYVDTPVDNENGRSFYEAIGYGQAYIMPEFYEEGLDGITYLKKFQVR